MKTENSRLIGFYSYKGGVGRSMALTHCAVELAKRGRKVLIVDLDLEAPGQHCSSLFSNQFAGDTEACQGFLNFSQAYISRLDLGLPDLQKYIYMSTSELKGVGGEDAGQIFLMPSGNVCDAESYRRELTEFDWDRLLEQGMDFAALRHLRSEFERLRFDDVLIDARTGDSDPFYVVALELADVLVMVSGYNRQNRRGTFNQLELLRKYPVLRQPENIILVGSPRPIGAAWDYYVAHVKPHSSHLPDWAVELPYNSQLALSEDVLNISSASTDDYVASIIRLVELIDNPKPVDSIIQPNILVNPFSVIRADYASNQDLIKFFVDPGEAITRALSDFMPVMVYGNRGTGKTTLAKHHSYETLADRLGRSPATSDFPARIGLYLRFDIDLLTSFNSRDLTLRPDFDALFANFFDILVVRKALSALEAFGGVSAWCDDRKLFQRMLLEFNEENAAQDALNYESIMGYFLSHMSKVRRFLNNPTVITVPFKVQGNILMKVLVESLLDDRRAAFGDRWFAVLVDEVEHFEIYQQQVLNSRIKQINRNDRVTYRFFLRHEGWRTPNTSLNGDQIVQEAHDFRSLYLDQGLLAEQFDSHVLLIAERQLDLQPQLGLIRLGLGQRRLESIFATLPPEEEARRILQNSKRSDQVMRLLRGEKKISVNEKFLSWYDNEKSILRRVVAVILLHQGKSVEDVVTGFEQGSPRASDWYHNYHRAALFLLCRLYHVNKTYAGLEQVLLLSGQNVRYFLEYCRAIVDEWIANSGGSKGGGLVLPISVEFQDRAIRARAQFYIDDLRGKPRFAEQMLNLVRRLGSVFSAAHASPQQSQFEVNHFSIVDYKPTRHVELKDYLRECRMENVLLRRPGNKQKSESDDRLDDWVLHPCFAPYFNISPRRKKKLEGLRAEDLIVLFSGADGEFGPLMKRITRKYLVDDLPAGSADGGSGSLFDDEPA